MCGRFGQKASSAELAAAFEASWRCPEPELPRFNIAPTQHAPVLLSDAGRRVLDVFRWGLIPSWAKDAAIGNKMINARAEGITEKPAFRAAFQRRRCLVPASGFFEWKKPAAGKGPKVPHWIFAADGGPLAFAGVWEFWRPAKDAEPVLTFTILTTTPSADVSGIHDRMPVIVAPADRDRWLNPETPADELTALLRSAPDGTLRMHPVSTAVNRPAFDSPELIQPLDDTPAPPAQELSLAL
ncbi:MAG: SOS response-associated peptidase [Gemmatimonadetes bacterium]|nr:SOS response-associated peptidase [Gemmatimonadota bacterium]